MLVCYVIVICVIGQRAFSDVIASFAGGYPVSNSWYVFACLYCYFLFWIAFYKNQKVGKYFNAMMVIIIGIIIYAIVMAKIFNWSDWWYKTIVCFPLGVLWGCYHERIKIFLRKNYPGIFVIVCIFFILSYLFPGIMERFFFLHGNHIWLLNDFLMGISGTLLIAIVLYKICVSNVVTNFLGDISYEIYLFHGCVMDSLKYVRGGVSLRSHGYNKKCMEPLLYCLPLLLQWHFII